MSQHTTVRPASIRRGAVSRFNDNTMEYAIAAARILTAVAALGWLVAVASLIWTSDDRWAVTGGLASCVTLAAGWFGFKVNGNEEWRHGKTD